MRGEIEVADLVKDLKFVRERGIHPTDLGRVPRIQEAIQQRFPDVAAHYRKARLRELLQEAAMLVEEPARTGIELAFGLHRNTDRMNSKGRREHFAAHFNISPETVRRANGLEDQVFEKLARAILLALSGRGSSQGDKIPLTSGSTLQRRDDLTGGIIKGDQFQVSRSPAAYRDMIGALEASARRIDRFPKRLSVVFKSDRAISRIAEQRFGRGSSMLEPYVEEHMLRRKTFYQNLAEGTVVREIYRADDLRDYLVSGHHGTGVNLESEDLEESVELWRSCMEAYPHNYLVAFTPERIPFKYEVIDSKAVLMHEAISGNDRDRLNAFAIVNVEVAEAFAHDFELVWERTPAADRMLQRTLSFIADLHKIERGS